jgi:hypothetical protein
MLVRSTVLRATLVTLAIAFVLVACDAAPANSVDAGAGDGGSTSDAAIVVADPAPPVLTPCPTGWREETGPSGVPSCSPWPATGYDEHCAFDSAHFPGAPGCARIGTACAADGWPSDLPVGRTVVYVDDGAAAGGDGTSRATALRSIGAAVTAAPTGGVIAVATGHYDEFVNLRAGQTLWGACVDGTRLTASTATPDHGVIDLAGDGSGVRNVGIDPSPRLGIYSVAANTTIDDVAIGSTALSAIWVDVGPVAVRNVVARDTRFYGADGWGNAIEIEAGASMTLDHIVLERAVYVGLYVDMGASVVANDVAIRGCMVGGVYMQQGGHLMLARAEIANVTGFGITTGDANSQLDATDLVVDGVTGTINTANAVMVQSGAHATLTRAHVVHYAAHGIAMASMGTDLTVTDALVEQGAPHPTDNGTGVLAIMSSALHLTRVRMDHAATNGIYLADMGTMLDATDLTITATRSDPGSGMAGNALIMFDGATATVTRGLFDDARSVALALGAAGTSMTATDLHIRGTEPEDAMDMYRLGRGIELQDSAQLTIVRGIVEQNHSAGAFVANAHLDATDFVIRDTRAEVTNQSMGVGLWAQEGGTVTLHDARIEGSRFAGIVMAGTNLSATGLVIDGVASADCATTSCQPLAGGFGLVSTFGGMVSVTGFDVRGAAVCGVLIGEDDPARGPTGMDLMNGVVEHAPVGACVQVSTFDIERLHHMVTYSDVGVPLQATSYMLPTML